MSPTPLGTAAPLDPRLLRPAAYAAGVSAAAGLLQLLVALLLIGPAAMVDPALLRELTARSPGTIYLQDGLKLAAALAADLLLVGVFVWLRPAAPRAVLAGTLAGALSVLCLLANAALSISATAALQSDSAPPLGGDQAGLLVAALGLGAVVLNGPWYLIVSLVARRAGALPKGLTSLGVALGVVSLLPPLALIVLVLAIVWSAWLCAALLRRAP